MDELAIPIYTNVFPAELLDGYDYIVDVSTRIDEPAGRHDVAQIPNSAMFDVQNEHIRDAIISKPVSNDGYVLPRILDISLRAFDDRKRIITSGGQSEYHTKADWLQWMIDDAMDVQPLKVDTAHTRTRVSHALFNCTVRLHAKKADTASYHVESVEIEPNGCNHAWIQRVHHLVNIEMLHCSQEVAYMLKPTYETIVHAERASTDDTFNGRTIELSRGHRVQLGDAAYEKLKNGLVQTRIEGKKPQLVEGEINSLNDIRQRWINSGHDRREIKALELCKILSTIGRKMLNTEEEPKNEADLSVKFQMELDEIFRPGNNERKNIFGGGNHRKDEDRFYVLIMIAASDTYEGRIWWSNPYPCLRGSLIAAEAQLGDVYNTMRNGYQWSVRPTYTPYDRSRESDEYIYSRENLFDSALRPGDKIIHWEYKLLNEVREVCIKDGNECDLFPEDEEMTTKFNEEKYTEMKGQIIQDGWNHRDFKMHKILQDGANVLTIDFEKDARIGNGSVLMLPEYYNKWIVAPMFNAKLRISETVIAKAHSDDPAVARTAKSFDHDPFNLQRYCLARYYDVRPGLMGRALSKEQEASAIANKVAALEDYRDVISRRLGYVEREKRCLTETAQYILEKTSLYLLNVLSMHVKPTIDMDIKFKHPSIDTLFDIDTWKIADISQLIVLLFDYLFESRKEIRSVTEARWILFKIRSVSGQERLDMIQSFFPRFGRVVRDIAKAKITQDVAHLNFFPLFFIIGDNMAYAHRQWSIPVLLYAHDIRIIPLEIGAYNNRFGFTSYLEYMTFFPSHATREAVLDESIKECSLALTNFYLNTDIHSGEIMRNVVTTKRLLYETHLASLCGGYSDGLLWYVPITHPSKCLVAFEVADDVVPYSVRRERIISRFPLSSKHLRGIALIAVDRNQKVSVQTEGIVTHRLCKKNLLKYVCDVVLFKFSGYVFGNDEMLTKLLNV
ncbi:VP2 [Bluetongue virus 23]|uniref:Outer capsid protein VP2 n=1 Tax=Bluetongue virus 23 TaxID=45031 RepID=L7WMD5_BTV|nr:VP2 [Bluetongue virus 23]